MNVQGFAGGLGIGYSRAAKLMDLLEKKGMIGPANGSKPRDVIGSSADLESQADAAIDGVLGPRTRTAVKSFRDRYGIEGGGEIDNQTLLALGAVELAANPKTP